MGSVCGSKVVRVGSQKPLPSTQESLNKPKVSKERDLLQGNSLKTLKKHKPKKFRKLLKKQLNPETRWEVWKAALNFQADHERFVQLISNPTQHSFSIEKDVERTFPNHTFFTKDTQAALRNVLLAFSSSAEDIGYCQGLNYVAGVLLVVSKGNQSETFGMLELLCCQFGIKGLFQKGFPLVMKMCEVFHSELSDQMPELQELLQKHGIDDNFWLVKWFLTLFSVSMKLEDVVRVWDNLFAKGLGFIVNVALAIAKQLKRQLLNSSDVLEVISKCTLEHFNVEKTLKIAKQFKKLKSCDFKTGNFSILTEVTPL